MNNKRYIASRRNFLLGLTSMSAMSALALDYLIRHMPNQTQATAARKLLKFPSQNLRQIAEKKGLLYGCAAENYYLNSDITYRDVLAQECGILVPENALKWDTVRPESKKFDFEPGEELYNFTSQHKMLFRGHTLVWHHSLPEWVEKEVNPQNAKNILTEHIQTVVGHFQGRVHSWDVVNEAIELTDNRPDGLRKTPWLEWLGPEYIDVAFRTAAQADPKALLVYNDFGLEYDISWQEEKRTAVLKLLENLKKKGVPIHALGIQAHLGGDNNRFSASKLKNFLSQVSKLGLKILITELDVGNILPYSGDAIERDRAIAEVYTQFLSIVLQEPAVIAVLTWGLSDKYSWLQASRSQKKAEALRERPLPFDNQMQRKPAWNAIAQAFEQVSR